MDDRTPAGEWVVAPRVIIRRGEYLKTIAPSEIPVKPLTHHHFVVMPNVPLPEGAFVEVHVIHGPIEVPPELQEELEAWQLAGANALELVERHGVTALCRSCPCLRT